MLLQADKLHYNKVCTEVLKIMLYSLKYKHESIIQSKTLADIFLSLPSLLFLSLNNSTICADLLETWKCPQSF